MKRFWPFVVIALGILIIFMGYVYNVLFAGIPYQDPTPELTANYNMHSRISSIICWSGVSVCFLGVVATIIRRVKTGAK